VEKKAEEIKEATVKLTDGQPGTTDYIAHHCRKAAELFMQLKEDEITAFKAIAEQTLVEMCILCIYCKTYGQAFP
jgi:hypothetical protein